MINSRLTGLPPPCFSVSHSFIGVFPSMGVLASSGHSLKYGEAPGFPSYSCLSYSSGRSRSASNSEWRKCTKLLQPSAWSKPARSSAHGEKVVVVSVSMAKENLLLSRQVDSCQRRSWLRQPSSFRSLKRSLRNLTPMKA